MFHLTLPVAVAGILLAGGTAVTATVLYTSGPLSGSDKPPADADMATVTASMTATAAPSGTPTAGGTPTRTGTLPPCIPTTPGGGPPSPCEVIGKQTLPPPPGAVGPNLPPAITLTPLPTPVGNRPYTPGPTPILPPFGPTSFPTAAPAVVAVAAMTTAQEKAQDISYALSKITGETVLTCGEKCREETDPIRLWIIVRDYCGQVPPGGFVQISPKPLWHPGYLAIDTALSSSCERLATRLTTAAPVDNTEWRAFASSLRTAMKLPIEALPNTLAQSGIYAIPDLRAWVVKREGGQ